MRVLSALAFALLLVMPLAAADVDGKWEATIEGPRGAQQATFALKAEGEALTGSVTNPRGETPIQDGKIQGDQLSFSQVLSFGDNEITITYTGKLAGDEIAFTRKFEGGPGGGRETTFTAKRVK